MRPYWRNDHPHSLQNIKIKFMKINKIKYFRIFDEVGERQEASLHDDLIINKIRINKNKRKSSK